MEQEPQEQQQPDTSSEPEEPVTRVLRPKDVSDAQAFIQALMEAAEAETAATGCICDRPDCAARAMHKLETHPEMKETWAIVKAAVEQQFDKLCEQQKKLGDQFCDLKEKWQVEYTANKTLQQQLEQAQEVNLALIKTVAHLSKK